MDTERESTLEAAAARLSALANRSGNTWFRTLCQSRAEEARTELDLLRRRQARQELAGAGPRSRWG